MLTDCPPELVTVRLLVALCPTWILPKLALDGLAASAPAATPVPAKPTFSVAWVALLEIVRLPVSLEAVGGANETLKVTP
jgi:hypothetical protein